MARILIVEDEPLISMMLEEWVEELGHTPLGPARTPSEALDMLRDTTPDVAIVDYHLQHETAEVVAQAMIEMQMPFAFASGTLVQTTSDSIAGALILSKPYDFESVRSVVQTLVGEK